MSEPLIYHQYPALRETLPRVPLGDYPTPLEKAAKLGDYLGFDQLWIKRDDLTASLYGGNKVRKLEYLLADARSRGKNRLITLGAIGSNHALATILHGSKSGFKTSAVLFPQPITEHVRKNMRADFRAGAEMFHAANYLDVPPAVLRAFWALRKTDGRTPYWIPAGGTSSIGTIGYVNAAFELKRQIDEGVAPEPDYIFVPVGSCGTFAGLQLGAQLAGLKSQILGVRVVDLAVTNSRMVSKFARSTAALLRKRGAELPEVKIAPRDFKLLHGYIGGGYGHLTDKGLEAIELGRELAGIKLEPTYTGKTFAAVIDALRRREFQDKTILYWNTLSSTDVPGYAAEGFDPKAMPPKFHQYFK